MSNLWLSVYYPHMLVKELFNPMGLGQSFGGTTALLDTDNCKVVNKTKQDSAVLLHMQREENGAEGHAYMRPKAEYESVAGSLLNWAFTEPRIVGLTLNELSQLDTGLRLSSVDGKIQVSQYGTQ